MLPGWTPAPGSYSARACQGPSGTTWRLSSPVSHPDGCGSRCSLPAGRCAPSGRGGLGAHKWLDRRLLADMARSMALQPGEQLLIEDADGDVLETDRANVFAVIGGVLHTPPADGRLLPGVARDAVLRAAGLAGPGVSVTPVSRARLQAASEVFVTSAVHGVRPVRSVAGSPAAWPAGPVASKVAAS